MRIQTLLPLLLALVAASCSTTPEEPAVKPPEYDLIILPTEEYPEAEAAKIASTIAKDTALRIKAVLPLGTRDWKPYSDRPQYDPEALKALALPAIQRLKTNYGGRVYVILTSRDIGPADKRFSFVFSQHDQALRISVVSTARLLLDAQGNRASPEIIQTRLRKMLLRTVALQYYGLQRSADIRDVTYSPLMTVSELDQMGLTITPK